ncbi:MAG: response regulator [Candidatus Omnitrophota bacterium]|nr:response regulator [Candidatus Omnitrophota bacterium]MDZ4242264.1 response regulator [Candidatus Omnitrophota bacterium]
MKKILVVDDELELCDMMKKCLEKTGLYQVTSTNLPEGVPDLCRTLNPDLVLMDIVMPRMKGTELIKVLRSAPETRGILLVVTSGLGEMVYHEKKDNWKWEPNRDVVRDRGDVPAERHAEAAAKAYGVDDFIAKPFTRETLLQVLGDVFARSTALGEDEVKGREGPAR